MATEDEYRRIVLSLPEVIEESHYGSPSFKVGKTFLTRLREDGENVVVPMNRDERDFWIEQEPGAEVEPLLKPVGDHDVTG